MKHSNFTSQSDANREQRRPNSSRAAVIRPLQAIEGSEQSFRMDADQDVRGPHLRSQQLNDFVSWLQKQSVEQLNQQETEPEFTSPFNHSSTSDTPGSQIGRSDENQKWSFTPSQSGDLVFGSKTNLRVPTVSQVENQPKKSSKPIIEFVSVKRVDSPDRSKTRIDQPHAKLDGNRVPAPKLPASHYHVDADLQRILRKLDSTEGASVDQATTADLDPPWIDQQVPQKSFSSDRSSSQNTPTLVDQLNQLTSEPRRHSPQTTHASERKKVLPAEFLQGSGMSFNSVIDTEMSQAISANPAGETLSKQEIIETVSKAIASVLTNQSESVIEKKVRERFDQLQQELRSQGVAGQTAPLQQTTPPASPSPILTATKPTPSPKAAQPVDTTLFAKTLGEGVAPPPQSGSTHFTTGHSKKIPVEVAAWDVNDFRWPTISTQMITVGAKAIDSLYRSLLNSLSKNQMGGKPKRVVVTAPSRQAGTTSIAMSLARWAVGEGRRVLLVDADLKNPEMSSQTGLGSSVSWGKTISTRQLTPSMVAEAIIRSQQSQLCLMPLGADWVNSQPPKFPLDFLARMIDHVSDHFDLIFVDAGPANQILKELSHPDLLLDTVLLVHQHRNLELDEVQNQLRRQGIEKFVLAQNAAQSSVASHVA